MTQYVMGERGHRDTSSSASLDRAAGGSCLKLGPWVSGHASPTYAISAPVSPGTAGIEPRWAYSVVQDPSSRANKLDTHLSDCTTILCKTLLSHALVGLVFCVVVCFLLLKSTFQAGHDAHASNFSQPTGSLLADVGRLILVYILRRTRSYLGL